MSLFYAHPNFRYITRKLRKTSPSSICKISYPLLCPCICFMHSELPNLRRRRIAGGVRRDDTWRDRASGYMVADAETADSLSPGVAGTKRPIVGYTHIGSHTHIMLGGGFFNPERAPPGDDGAARGGSGRRRAHSSSPASGGDATTRRTRSPRRRSRSGPRRASSGGGAGRRREEEEVPARTRGRRQADAVKRRHGPDGVRDPTGGSGPENR